MNNTFNTFEKIASTSSRNEKIDLLMELKEDEFAKFYIQTVFDPYLTYGVCPTKQYYVDARLDADLNVLKDVRDKLVKRELTGDRARIVMNATISTGDALWDKWIYRMWDRDMKCGISYATIDKVFSGLVAKYEIQLCDKLTNQQLNSNWLVSRKLNGFRMTIEFEGSKIVARSRNGHELFNVGHIIDELKEHVANCAVDGELMSFSLNNSWNKTASTARASKSKRDGTDLGFNVFYVMSIGEWKARKCVKTFGEVVKDLEVMIPNNLKYVKKLENYAIKNREDAWELADQFFAEGYEGAVAKDINSVYQFGRACNWIKLKRTNEIELEVVDLVSGTIGSKYEECLGAMICRLPNGSTVSVGGGFSDLQRKDFWSRRCEIIGKMIEIKYQEITKDGSLLFPVFKCVRSDK